MVVCVMPRRVFLLALLCACVAVVYVCADPLVVQTSKGTVKGKYHRGAKAFFSIPFAKPVSGTNRWKDPVPPDAWNGVLSTTALSPHCPQICLYNQGGQWLCPEPNIPQDEDCLFINVYAPKDASAISTNFPVMVFLHGGAHSYSYAGALLYDGSYLASHYNIIVVTFEYRLGMLGYLAYGDGADAINGNFGFKDQQLALKWVRENIAAFGGDQNKITLCGQSAGAVMTAAHMTNNMSLQYFDQVILQSPFFGGKFRTLEEQKEFTKDCIQAVPCGRQKDIDCLRDLPVSDILEIQNDCVERKLQYNFELRTSWTSLLVWQAVIDEVEIFDTPLASDKPLLLGTVKDDGDIFFTSPAIQYGVNNESILNEYYNMILLMMFGRENIEEALKIYPKTSSPTKQLSQAVTDFCFVCPALEGARKSALNNQLVYSYVFDVPYPILTPPSCPAFCDDKSCHGCEGAYTFHIYEDYYTEEEERIGKLMSSYWASFVTSGAPVASDDVTGDGFENLDWPEYSLANSYKSIVIDKEGVTVESDYGRNLCSRIKGYEDRSFLLYDTVDALRIVGSDAG